MRLRRARQGEKQPVVRLAPWARFVLFRVADTLRVQHHAKMAYNSGSRWNSRCASACSNASSSMPLSHSSPSLISLRTKHSFVPISPSASPMHTPRRGSPLSISSSVGPSTGIRKPKGAPAARSPAASDGRARALAMAANAAPGARGAAGEDARRPFCGNALLGFALDAPSRAMPMPRTPPAVASASMVPVPLTKSQSAPAGFGFEDVTKNLNLQNPLESNPEEITQTPWMCRGCGSTNEDDLELNDDSAYTCKCGVVDQQRCISLARQGMCAREDDNTDTADARMRDAAQEAAQAVANGPETNDARRRRLLAGNGTRIGGRAQKRNGIGGAAGRLETQACHDIAPNVEGPVSSQKLQRIVEYLETSFDWLGKTLVEPLRRHVRMETQRVLRNSALHAQVCTSSSNGMCSLDLAKRPNYLIAQCMLQETLERLKVDAHRATVARECTVHELNEHLERLRQLEEQSPSSGQMPRVRATVRLLLDWQQGRVLCSCNGEHHSQTPSLATTTTTMPASAGAPPPFALPPAAASIDTQALDSPRSMRSSVSAASVGDTGLDAVFGARDAITGAAIRANVRADVRCAAMAAIAQQELGDYIRARNVLPVDVLGVAVLAAVSTKMELEDATSELLAQCCHDQQISPTTARVAIEAMAKILHVEPAAASGVFGDGIF